MSGPGRGRAHGALVRHALLVLVPLLIVVLGAEMILRATHLFQARVSFTEPDDEIGYRFTPGRPYWFFGENDHPIQGRINALGWRDRERARRKPDGVYRVAVVGDSFVEAFQVEQDSTFLAIAERRLNAASTPVRVEFMNFGRSGMTASEEHIVLERDVLPCEPDAVLLLFTPGNDIADLSPVTADNTLRPFPRVAQDGSISFDRSFAASRGHRVRAWINPLKQRSALVSLMAERYNVLRRQDAPAAVAPTQDGPIARERSLCTTHPDPHFLVQYDIAKLLLADMARRCAARGVDFWLMSVPAVRRGSEVDALRERDASFDPTFFDRDLAALAHSTGAGFVPLTARFLAGPERGGEDLFWAHWSYAGHRAVAGELVRHFPAGSR